MIRGHFFHLQKTTRVIRVWLFKNIIVIHTKMLVSFCLGSVPYFILCIMYCQSIYSITSVARTRMARLPWMIRTRFSVPTKSFK